MKNIRTLLYSVCALALVGITTLSVSAETRLIESITALTGGTESSSVVSGAQEYRFSVKLNGPVATLSAREYPNLRLVTVPQSSVMAKSDVISCIADPITSDVKGSLSVETSHLQPQVLTVVVTGVTGEGRFGLCPLSGQSIFVEGAPIVSGYFDKNDVPTVSRVSSQLMDATYRAGETIVVEVAMSEPVRLSTGFDANLDLKVGEAPGIATLLGAPLQREMVTDTLVFTYMVSYRDSTPDLQYESESALIVTQGTVADAHSLVPARLNLPAVDSPHSLAGNKNIALNTDGVIPVTTSMSDVEETAPSVVTTPKVSGSTQMAQQKPNQMVLMSKSKTAHCPAIHGYWKLGDKGLQVRKIQMFLNVYEGQKLVVDGIYGYQTRQAVKEFQRNHKNEILSPWGLSKVEATGYWYKTTSKAANYLVGCDSESIELENGAEVDEYSPTFNPYIESLPQPFYRFIRNQYRELSKKSSSVAQHRDDSGKYRGMSMLSEEVQSQAPPVMK